METLKKIRSLIENKDFHGIRETFRNISVELNGLKSLESSIANDLPRDDFATKLLPLERLAFLDKEEPLVVK